MSVNRRKLVALGVSAVVALFIAGTSAEPVLVAGYRIAHWFEDPLAHMTRRTAQRSVCIADAARMSIVCIASIAAGMSIWPYRGRKTQDAYRRCEQCGYIVDFLPRPRCPECGTLTKLHHEPRSLMQRSRRILRQASMVVLSTLVGMMIPVAYGLTSLGQYWWSGRIPLGVDALVCIEGVGVAAAAMLATASAYEFLRYLVEKRTARLL